MGACPEAGPEAGEADGDAGNRGIRPEARHRLRPHRAYGGAGDAALVAGVQRGDPEAWDAFFVRFEPVLVCDARRLGVPDTVRDDLVCETVTAALERLSAEGAGVPGSLLGYLRHALRNRYLNHRRGELRRERRVLRVAEPVAECAGVLTSTVSAYTLALVDGPALEHAYQPDARETAPRAFGPAPHATPIRALAAALAAAMRPGEQELLERWHGGATQRELAAWLEISVAAAAKRVARLRQRLHAVAYAHAATLPEADRREVLRFLDRAHAAAPLTTRSPTRRRATARPTGALLTDAPPADALPNHVPDAP